MSGSNGCNLDVAFLGSEEKEYPPANVNVQANWERSRPNRLVLDFEPSESFAAGLREDSDRYFEERNQANAKLRDIGVIVRDLVMTAKSSDFTASHLLVNGGLLGTLERLVTDEAAQGEVGNLLSRQLADARAKLKEVQDECCRLTDLNGDLAKLADAVVAVVDGWESARRQKWPASLDADSPNGVVLERAYRAFKARQAEDDSQEYGDYIDYLWSEIHRLQTEKDRAEARVPGPEMRPVCADWFDRLDNAIVATINAFKDDCGPAEFKAKMARLEKIRAEGFTAYTPPVAADREESKPESVNARLLKAAKAVHASHERRIDDAERDEYGSDWTGVDDSDLTELGYAIQAAEAEDEEDEGAGADAGVDAGQIVREQSDRIAELGAKLIFVTAERDNLARQASDWIGNRQYLHSEVERLKAQVEALGRVSASALELQREYPSLDRLTGVPIPFRRVCKSLMSALDDLPVNKLPGAKPDAPCDLAACQRPCLERYHMLAVAVRNAILAYREHKPMNNHIAVMDFALTGLI